MFERQVVPLLNHYLGRYAYNVDASALKISVLSGNVELHNLQLKPEALNELNLPITVKSGLLGSLKLKVPWANLGREPVICELDSIYVLAVPNTGEAQTGKDVDEAELEQANKRQKVDEAENEFIKAWKQSLEMQAEKQSPAKGKQGGQEGQGRLQYYLETILGNLQISVTNVHIRYEDAESVPGEVFACGLTLEEISAFTVDDNNKRTFVSSHALEHLRKTATLRRLALYFDVGSKRWSPPTGQWKSMARSHWEAMFRPSVSGSGPTGGPDHLYILAPVNGRLTYDHINGKLREKLPESHPTEKADVSLASVDLRLAEGQYKCMQALLESISMHNQRMPHMHLRPRSRPQGRRAVRRWWQYAMRATMGEGSSGKGLTWEAIRAACRVRREYIPMYVECLTSGKVGGNDRIRELDKNLSISVIMHFRKTAHMKVEKQKRLAAVKKREQQIASGEGRGWFSFMGWSPGGGGSGNKATAEALPSKLDLETEFNEDEMAQMEAVAAEQKRLMEEAKKAATPFTVLKAVKMTIESCSVALLDTSNMEVIKAAMHNASVQSSFYRTTIEAGVQIGEIRAWSFDDELMTSNMESLGKRSVLDLHLTHLPQDGRADDVIHLTCNPTYITYDGKLMERMLAFAERNRNVNLGAIGAQAGAMADSMAAEVKTKVTAAWEARQTPRMLINLTMEAPRIALPLKGISPPESAEAQAAGGMEEVLVLDLGYFQLQSDSSAAAQLSEAESRVYECICLKGSRMQASFNLIQGPFSWKRWEDARRQLHVADRRGSIPLVDPIEVYCEFQFAKFKHPTLPSLRSKVTLPRLQFHMSPARLSRVMAVVNDLTGPAAAQQQPAWVKEVDFSGDVRLLTWSGMSFSNAAWEERWGALWYGWLYVMDGEESYHVVRSTSIFNQHTLKVPPEAVDGMEHVVAICSEPKVCQRVLESPDTVILQFKSAPVAATWLWRIHLAKQRMAALIPSSFISDELGGGGDVSKQQSAPSAPGALAAQAQPTDDSGPTPPATPSAGMSDFATAAEANPEDAIRARSSKESITGTFDIGAFQLWVSGRTVDIWWPAQDFTAGNPQKSSYPNEVPLIVIHGQGMRMDAQMSATHISSSASLASLMIHDLLVGPQRSDCRHLAVSNKLQLLEDLPSSAMEPKAHPLAEGSSSAYLSADGRPRTASHDLSGISFKSRAAGDDEFFDAQETMSVASQSSESPANPNTLTQRSPGSMPALLEGFDLGEDAPEAQESSKLARITFKLWKPESPLYDGVDVEVSMKLATLFFFCNRPTVGALMAIGPDMSAAMQQPANGDGEAPDRVEVAVDSGRGRNVIDAGNLVKGAEDRVTFRLLAEMQTLEATFNYEGTDAFPLLEASMQQFSFNLDIKPSTLNFESKLGNLIAQDKSFGHTYLYSTICDIRPEGGIDSLIELNYATFKGSAMPDTGGRVPPGTDFSWVKAKLNAVDVIFLNRQLQELLTYIDVLLAMQPPPNAAPLPQVNNKSRGGSGRSTPGGGRQTSRTHSRRSSRDFLDMLQSRASFTEERGGESGSGHRQSGKPSNNALRVLLDVDMRAPVITMPLSSFSDDEVEVDLGHLQLTNRIVYEPCGGHSILMDVTDVTVSGISTSTTVKGERNSGLVHFEKDACLRTTMRRMLDGPEHAVPGISMDVVIPEVHVEVKDKEFQLITAISSSNLNESLNVPPGVKALEQALALRRSNSQSLPNSSPIFEEDEHTEAEDDSLWPSVKVTVQLCATRVMLLTTAEGVADGHPLASMLMPGLSVDYKGSAAGMSVLVAIPNIIVKDLRQCTPDNSRVVMASSVTQGEVETGRHHSAPSMVVLQYVTDVLEGSQVLNTRLQRPTFIAEMGFVMALLSFVSPPKQELEEYITGDLLLKSEATRAKSDLWLSPDCRLLADGPHSDSYLFDGCGMRMVLPPGIQQSEPLPLIMVGSGKTLRLCNVDIVNAGSLAGCLQLGHGGQLIALPEDGVAMTLEDSFEAANATAKTEGNLDHVLSLSKGPVGQDRAGNAKGRITVNLTAMGMSLNFLDLVRNESDTPATSEKGDAAASLAVSTTEQASYMLTTNLDIAMTYSLDASGNQLLEADLHDVVVEAFLSGAAAQECDISTFTLEPPGGYIDNTGSNTLLQPCDVTFKYGTYDKMTDIKLDTSDMIFTLSVDMLDVLARLQDRVLGPLSKPSADRPVAAAMTFTKIWAHTAQPHSGMPPYANARDVDLFNAERGFTIWRPQVPFGYVSLGDVITQGCERPRHHAACIARESGLTALPLDYQLVLMEDDLCIWTPVPPDGFVSLGCVCSTSRDPPPLGTVTCVRADVAVQTAPGECLAMRTRRGYNAQHGGNEPAIEHVRLWTVSNSPATFVLVVSDTDAVSIPSGLCFDLRSPLGCVPLALHSHITEAASHGRLHAPSASVVRHRLELPALSESGAESEHPDLDTSDLSNALGEYEVLEWDVALQQELAFAYARRDHNLHHQRTRDHQCLEVAEFQKLFLYDNKEQRVTFWRPMVPPEYIHLGDCMSIGMHPPKLCTVFQDDSLHATQSEELPNFARPIKFQKMWEGPSRVRSGEKSCVSLWQPVPPAMYVAVGWVAWTGRSEPSGDSCSVRCIRSDLVELVRESASQKVTWPMPGSQNKGRRKPKEGISMWSSNQYTCSFLGNVEQAERLGASPSIYWEISLMHDAYVTNQHAARLEDPHYKITLDTGLMSLLLLDMAREPLVEMNLGGADALQGRSHAGQNRSGRHCKRPGVSAHMRESAPGLLQAFSELSMELWSYNKTRWEPVLEPFGVLVHFHHNSRSRIVSTLRPGTHVKIKATSDEGLHLTVAHAALDSLLRSAQDAAAVMAGGTQDMLSSGRKSARYAYVHNRLGVPCQCLLNYGMASTQASMADGDTLRMLLPRAIQYQRKRPEPPFTPKGLLAIDVKRLQLHPGVRCQGGIFASVALVPAHELDQCMTVQTRWAVPGPGGAVEWAEQLLLKLPDDEVAALSNLRAEEAAAAGCELSESSIILQVAAHDVDGRGGRGARVAAGTVQLTHAWMLAQLSSGEGGSPLARRVKLVAGGGGGGDWGEVEVEVRLEWSTRASGGLSLPKGAAGRRGQSPDSRALSNVRLRLGEDDPWSLLSSMNAVRRGAGDSGALSGGGDPRGDAAAVRPIIVTPVTALHEEGHHCFAIEESVEQGVRRLEARSLCQVTNQTGVTLKVGLVRSNIAGATQRQQDASIMDGLLRGKRMTSSIVNGSLQVSVVEAVYENQRYVSMRGFGAEGYLNTKDERQGHRRYEWTDTEGKQCSDWSFPTLKLPPGWQWASDWALECGHQGEASDGYIYGSTWEELTFPPVAGMEKVRQSGVRRRLFTRRRVLVQSNADNMNEGVELLGSVPPYGRLPLPLNWDDGNVQVVMRPDMSPGESAQDEDEAAVVMQMCQAAHRWSICMSGESSGINLGGLQDGKAQLMACPPSHPSQGAVQLATPGRSLRKFTAFQGTVFWMSVQAVAHPFQGSAGVQGLVDWEIVVTPPLVVENLLPVSTDFFLWEKPQGGSSLKLRCEGTFTSGGSVQVHSVDMRNEVYISVAPDSCSKEAEPVLLSPGIDARSAGPLPISFNVHHIGHECRTPLTLFLERQACAKVADTDPAAMAAIAQGSKLTVSLYAGLVVLNGTQLPLYVATERGKSRRRMDGKGPQQLGPMPMGTPDSSLPMEETLGVVRGSTAEPQACKFQPGTVQMMSFPLQSEHEYVVKVALAGSTWAQPMSLENEVPTPPWLLRAHIGGTQQIHEVVVSLVSCSGAFGRSKLLKLDPHVVVTNLTGLPLQLRQCISPKPVVSSSPQNLLRAVSSSKALSSRGGERMAQAGLHAARALEDSGKEAVKHMKGRLHTPLSMRSRSLRNPFASAPVSSGGSEAYQDPLMVASRPVPEWQTDSIGVMDLPADSVAVPMYWSESCWQKSLCVSLVEHGGAQRLSSPIHLTLPGFEEQYISVPTALRDGRSGDGRSTELSDEIRGGTCPFAYGSRRAAAAKLRTSLAGSPLCRPLGADSQMQECYSEEESLVLRVSATVKRFNCLHLTFHSVSTQAPAAVENRSADTLLFRKLSAVAGGDWQIAHPWSCVPVVWDCASADERAVEVVELGLADRGIPRRYRFRRDPKLRAGGSTSLDTVDLDDHELFEQGGSGAADGPAASPSGLGASMRGSVRGGDSGWAVVSPEAGSGRQPLLPTSDSANTGLLARLETAGSCLHPMAAGSVQLGAGTVSSRALGTSARPQHLVLVANSEGAAEGAGLLASQLRSLPTRLYLGFSLPSIHMSVVDHTPQELILVSVDGLHLEYAMGLGPANTVSRVYLKVEDFQVDNMLPYTRYPVFMAPVTAKADRAEDPVLEVVCSAEPSPDLGHVYYPYIYARVGKTLVINMCEALVWNALAMHKILSLPGAGSADAPANVQADSTVEIKLLMLGELKTRLSFGTAPDARAASETGSVGYLISLAAFKDLTFDIDGMEYTGIHNSRSILMEDLIRHCNNQVFTLAFRILRSSVSLQSASRAIGGVSSQVAKLSLDDEYREIRDQQSQQEARHLGEGLAGGGEAFAKSVLWGFTGIVRRPWQGAQQSGALGFMEGLGTGMVGAVVQPVSGLLDLVSKTAEGAGATMDKATKVFTGEDIPRPKLRRRLPRAISGDQQMQPFNKEAAQGQMLLWAAKRAPGMEEIINMRFRMVRVAKYKGDKYEAHLKLPASRYALITNTRVMLLSENSKSALSPSKPGTSSSGGARGSSDVVLEWECEWGDVLSLQPKRSKSAPVTDPPDRLILYRKDGSPEGVMQHEWRCESRSAQAEQLLEMVQSARLKYSESFRHTRIPDAVAPGYAPALAASSSRSPEPGRSLAAWSSGGWKLVWRSYASSTVSIWRPVAREGYAVLGDVLVEGAASPDTAVLTLRDDTAALDELDTRHSPASSSSRRSADFPLTAQPVSYWLVWRTSGKGSSPGHIANGEGPLSLWLPVAPNDRYRALGCVAMSSLEEPPLSMGRCVRRDLLDAAELEPSPAWKGIASDKTSWRCTMWRISHSSVCTFFASRIPDSRGFRFYRPARDVVQTAQSSR